MEAAYDPAVRAKQVLESMGITDPPATHLDEIAQMQHIRIGKKDLPDDPKLSGLLLFRGKRRAILINTHISNPGRINFTFAHELGHHFLQHAPTYTSDGQRGFRCTVEDVQNGGRPKEVEANRFASALLMPEDQFHLAMVGSALDYTLIATLARQFHVSKHACCNRLLEFTREPYIVIRSRGCTITEIHASAAARRKLPKLESIPEETFAYKAITENKNQDTFDESDAVKWLSGPNLPFHLYEWTRGSWSDNVAMTILRW